MEQIPSCEATSCFVMQETPFLLWNLKVHYPTHTGLPLFSVLSKLNPVHILLLYFFKNHYNIIFPSLSRSSRWSLQVIQPQLYFPSYDNTKKLRKESTLWSSLLYNFVCLPNTSSLVGFLSSDHAILSNKVTCSMLHPTVRPFCVMAEWAVIITKWICLPWGSEHFSLMDAC